MAPSRPRPRATSLGAHLKPHHKLWLNWDGRSSWGRAIYGSSTRLTGGGRTEGPVGRGWGAIAQSAPAPFSTTPKLTGYLQPRFGVHGDTAVFFLRRARFALEGKVTPWASYRARVEMRRAGAAATPAASPLSLSATDLWVKATHGGGGATLGQFPVPFALESLLSSTTPETTD